MKDTLDLTREELQLIHAACMSCGDRLSDMVRSLPNEGDEATGRLSDRADKSWCLAGRIRRHMAEI